MVVHGMFLTTVTSLAVSVVERWMSMPWWLRLVRRGTVTSMPERSVGRSSCSAAALRWEEDRAGAAGQDGGEPAPVAGEQ